MANKFVRFIVFYIIWQAERTYLPAQYHEMSVTDEIWPHPRNDVNYNYIKIFIAGCEYHGYSSDITRTWPIDGAFTPQQRVLYEIVLDVQKTLTSQLKELPTLDQVFHDMCVLLGKRLQEIGLIPSSLSGDKLIAATFTYCPHHVSHYLGMDVHDTGKISRTISTKPGMIVTMEPGEKINHILNS